MPTTADLRALLEADADEAATSRPSVAAAIRRGRRVRALRRVAVPATAVLAGAAIALPVLLTASPVDETPRATQTTPPSELPGLPPGGGWVADLPGVDLEVGEPLGSAYAVGDQVFVGGRSYELGGDVVVQLLEVPEGVVLLTVASPDSTPGSSEQPTYELRLLVDDGTSVTFQPLDRAEIRDIRASVDPEGLSPTRLAWISSVADQSGEVELRSVVLGDSGSASSITGPLNSVEGFLDGDVVATVETPGSSTVELARWTPGTDVIEDVGALPPDGSFVLAAARPGRNPHLAVVYSGSATSPQCIYAAPLTDLATRLWSLCEGGPAVIGPDGGLGATQLGVFEVATGEPVSTFEFGSAEIRPWDAWSFEPGDTGIDARVVGWSGDDAVVQLSYATATSTTPADGGAWRVNPWYVYARCSASTGECERVPHPVDVLDGYRL